MIFVEADSLRQRGGALNAIQKPEGRDVIGLKC
jgi:hypothetical protein